MTQPFMWSCGDEKYSLQRWKVRNQSPQVCPTTGPKLGHRLDRQTLRKLLLLYCTLYWIWHVLHKHGILKFQKIILFTILTGWDVLKALNFLSLTMEKTVVNITKFLQIDHCCYYFSESYNSTCEQQIPSLWGNVILASCNTIPTAFDGSSFHAKAAKVMVDNFHWCCYKYPRILHVW